MNSGGSVAAHELPAFRGGQPVRPQPITCTVPADQELRAEIMDLLSDGLLSDYYGGPHSKRLEAAFAGYHGDGMHAVAVNSGTSALHLALAAAGVGAGDEVILPALCFVSAASAVVQLGGLPVICDVEPDSLTLDVELAETLVTERTKAVLPVHFWGYPADLPALRRMCDRHGLALIEDAAQAPGAKAGGAKIGTYGDFATYSLGVRKHIACGEGGLVLTRTAEQADRVRSLTNVGKGPGWDDYRSLGFSYRMVEFSALVAMRGLRLLDTEIAARRHAAEQYRTGLRDTGLCPVPEPSWGESVYFKLPVLLPETHRRHRQFMVDAIGAENVSCRVPHRPLYAIPWLKDHLVTHDRYRGADACPVAGQAHPRLFEVETGPHLPEEEAALSVRAVQKVWRAVQAEKTA